MYGEPLQPKRCKFDIGIFDGLITIFVTDLDQRDNDDVRDIVHPDFDKYWGNEMENVFSTDNFKTMREAKDWLTSIGMEYDGFTDNTESKDIDKVLSPMDRYSVSDLKGQLKSYELEENYEKCAEIQAEIKRRESVMKPA